jgi:hypothetical protein
LAAFQGFVVHESRRPGSLPAVQGQQVAGVMIYLGAKTTVTHADSVGDTRTRWKSGRRNETFLKGKKGKKR